MTTRLIWRTTRAAARVGTKVGTYSAKVVGKAVAGRVVTLPAVEDVPQGRMVELPGRGRTFVVDVAGPTPDAPTAVLLSPALTVVRLPLWELAEAGVGRMVRALRGEEELGDVLIPTPPELVVRASTAPPARRV